MIKYNVKKKEDLLPELNDEEIEWAVAPDKQSWVYLALSQGPGYVWIDAENGYAMQIGWKGFELLSIVDHPWCTHYVSLINATLESIGHELGMENTIIRPLKENPENNENPEDENVADIVGHTTIQKFGLINDDSVWRSEIKLEDGRDSAIGIDSGIKLHSDQNPRITAIELNSGKIISQRKVEYDD